MSDAATPHLVLDRLNKFFGSHHVIQDLSLELEEGEVLALLGPSGSGKTTILRLLAGFTNPDVGRILVAGEEVTTKPPAKRGFGMVFQNYALFPHLSVGRNISFGLEARALDQEAIAQRVEEMLALVDLEGFEGRKVSEISGGQQQRVALARALAPEPRLLMLDEPLSNLDPELRERTRRALMKALRSVGITTVIVTHEQEEAFELGDRVAVLHDGRLDQVGSPEDLYQRPATRFVATFVGRASVLQGIVEGVSGERWPVRLLGREEGDGGLLWMAASNPELRSGDPVDLIVRPEGVRLVPPDHPESLQGRVIARQYTGPATYYSVALELGPEVEVAAAPDAAVLEERVGLVPQPEGPVPRIFPRTRSELA